MRVTREMLEAAEKALGYEVDPRWLQGAVDHHGETTLTELKVVLETELEDFERKGGRDVAQADYIDGLRAAIAARRRPRKDPRMWRPKRPKGRA